MVWEVDDTPCVIKTDKNMTQVLQGIASAVGAVAIVISKPNSTSDWVRAAGIFIGAVYSSASWLLSNDDFLGAATMVTPNATQSTIYTTGSQQNGYIHTTLRGM